MVLTKLLTLLSLAATGFGIWDDLNLPPEHMPFFFNNNPNLRKMCREDASCPYKESVYEKKCWGYEQGCEEANRLVKPLCPGDAKGWVKNKNEQLDKFWRQADFGYIKERTEELVPICTPRSEVESSLKCAKYTRFCIGKNIFMDFAKMDSQNSRNRFKEGVFEKGMIGGQCDFDEKRLGGMGEHKSPLQSWYAELEEFSSLDFNPLEDNKCEVIIDKPTLAIKLDAGVNMYHHFCDFVNLYASQHINNTFDQDINILMWDTSPMHYGDLFHVTWDAFTTNPILKLHDFNGKKVCFRDIVFSLLPRMRYGLYYNMPVIPGCQDTSLFNAFSHHILHRLGVKQDGPLKDKIRVTLLSRSTKYRQILNQEEIVDALSKYRDFEVKVVDFNHKISFIDQLRVTYNSDILMGMHGAGLTHLLFQPDWGSIFEIYNCDDKNCYKDLARLRGVHYFTWENIDKLVQEDEGHHPTLGAHKKFTNYSFDIDEFLQLVANAAEHVRNSPSFKKAWQEKYGEKKDHSRRKPDEL